MIKERDRRRRPPLSCHARKRGNPSRKSTQATTWTHGWRTRQTRTHSRCVSFLVQTLFPAGPEKIHIIALKHIRCGHQKSWLKCPYARVIPSSCHPWWAFDRPFLFASSCCLSPCFSPSCTSYLPHSTCKLSCTPSMWTAPRETPAAPSHNEECCPMAKKPSSRRLWAQRPWWLPLLRDYWNDFPGRIRRHGYGALVLVWRGTRRWDHRKSAIFTTVHLGARRTSGPKTSLSLLWIKFTVSSVRFYTRMGRPVHEFCSSQKREVKSRNEQRKNQDSFWKTKSKILLTPEPRFRNTNFKPILIEEVFRIWMELSSLCEEIHHTLADERRRRDQQFLMRWKNWSDFKGQESMNFRECLIENQDAINELKTHGQNSGTTECSWLSEWFERFSRCRFRTQWTIPRYQSTCVFPLFEVLAEC